MAIPEHTGYVCADYMDVRTIPVEVQQDGSLSISLDPELIRQMLEQAEEEGGEVTSTDLGLTPEMEQPEKKKANPLLLALPLILVFGGVGGYFYLKTKRSQTGSSRPDPDAGYRDDDDDLDIYEIPEDSDGKEASISEDDPDYWLDEEDDE